MKTTILKHRFLYLFILLGLTISFNSCSDDDELKSFLEKYYETLWKSTDRSDYTEYIKFIGKTKFELGIWVRHDEYNEDCFYHSYENDDYTIIENSSNKLVLESTWDDGGDLYKYIITITVSGDIMKVVMFDENENESETYFYEKSSTNVDDLPICND